jgi:hypothetical protein
VSMDRRPSCTKEPGKKRSALGICPASRFSTHFVATLASFTEPDMPRPFFRLDDLLIYQRLFYNSATKELSAVTSPKRCNLKVCPVFLHQ